METRPCGKSCGGSRGAGRPEYGQVTAALPRSRGMARFPTPACRRGAVPPRLTSSRRASTTCGARWGAHLMEISRRRWMGTNLLLPAAAGALGALGLEAAPQESATRSLPKAFDALRPLGERVHPITAQEFAARHEHAQAIMASAEPGFEAMYITSGSALYYFTGFRWGLSERLMAF